MTNKNTLLLLLAFALTACAAPSFKKGYKAYTRHSYPAAAAIFDRYQNHKKYASAARYFNAKIRLSATRDLPGLLVIDHQLAGADSLYRHLPARQASRLLKKYTLDTSSILDLRLQTQRWMVAWLRARGTLPALDTLRTALPKPLPPVQPELEAAHRDIINAHLETADYDTMTAILRRHLTYVLPENYGQTRRMNEQLWPAFLKKYPPCALDSFARAHPLTFVGRDCWRKEVRELLCSGDLAQMLDFHRQNSWTALEVILLNSIADKSADSIAVAALSPTQQQHLLDLRRRNQLRDRLRTGVAEQDTAATLQQAVEYIEQYAPRYSAFRLMEEALQFFLEHRHYTSAIDLLEGARPYFPDMLPPGCGTNFDYQLRVRPWIDGKLPILRQPAQLVSSRPLQTLNTPEGDESSPVVLAGQQEIFFAASGRKDNLAGQDVFTGRWDAAAGDWATPALVPELSGPGQQIPLSCTADGRRLLLLINGRLHLATRARPGASWNTPVPVAVSGIPILGRGCLSAGGDTLILEGAYAAGTATQSPDLDLFVSIRDRATGEWSRPYALGADINTDLDETRPLLSPDGRTLWYVSAGYPGLGRSDVFVSRHTGPGWAQWKRPLNLGKERNDTFPHRGYTSVSADGRMFWWSVEGEDGKGDLWEVRH